jgi:hypothetical protein
MYVLLYANDKDLYYVHLICDIIILLLQSSFHPHFTLIRINHIDFKNNFSFLQNRITSTSTHHRKCVQQEICKHLMFRREA